MSQESVDRIRDGYARWRVRGNQAESRPARWRRALRPDEGRRDLPKPVFVTNKRIVFTWDRGSRCATSCTRRSGREGRGEEPAAFRLPVRNRACRCTSTESDFGKTLLVGGETTLRSGVIGPVAVGHLSA